ncbi:malonyl CoA-ACP transacylase [Herbaspirillum hiltneri N3]|uniref:Malonyl CoA-ACP transacylase n=1 Tax=Herbaspirillum hiltneri N3 TaxID=1262470 RepID=A0ABN4HZ99_9BURK|nr:acyltransferase domain-containing protein [Herbaspirillum hiltneri]AKZ63922.1 malonyl CoA-ACP transacylase [Herbaspirillum hiltneri N3]
MSQGFAVLCPGQGGQHPAMFDLLRADTRGQDILREQVLATRFDRPLDEILHDPQLLFANRYAQPLIVATGLAAWRVLRDELPPPALVAGYSIGELTAYGVAGALTDNEAIDLAAARAAYMDASLAQAPHQGLMSVGGVEAGEVEELLRRHGAFVAIVTGFDTLIAGGRSDDLLAAANELEGLGARTGILPVGIASHTPLMESALSPFTAALDALDFREPACAVLAGVSGLEIHDIPSARRTLAQQLTHTIRWSSCMDACAERGVGVALELGPGSALSRMLRERHPHIECRSVSDFRSLAGVVNWLRSRLD